MIKNNVLFLLCCFCGIIPVRAQDKEWKTEDINRDGVMDSIAVYYDGGSGFGGRYIEIINGKTKEMLQLDTWRCFCRTKGYVLFPEEFLSDDNKLFLERTKEELLGEIRFSPDAALQWILSSTFSKVNSDSDPDLFEYWFQYNPQWVNTKPVNSNYYLPLHSDTLKILYTTDGDMPEFAPFERLTGGVLMGGAVLGQYADEPALRSGDFEFYLTAHSVVAKNSKTGLWSYVFITDYEVTGAPEKMRWGSVKDVAVSEDYLFIRHGRGHDMDHFFIVNYLDGKSGQLKFTCYGEDKVVLQGGAIYYNDRKIAGMDDLIKALDAVITG